MDFYCRPDISATTKGQDHEPLWGEGSQAWGWETRGVMSRFREVSQTSPFAVSFTENMGLGVGLTEDWIIRKRTDQQTIEGISKWEPSLTGKADAGGDGEC